jgi:hypothetical protein
LILLSAIAEKATTVHSGGDVWEVIREPVFQSKSSAFAMELWAALTIRPVIDDGKILMLPVDMRFINWFAHPGGEQ